MRSNVCWLTLTTDVIFVNKFCETNVNKVNEHDSMATKDVIETIYLDEKIVTRKFKKNGIHMRQIISMADQEGNDQEFFDISYGDKRSGLKENEIMKEEEFLNRIKLIKEIIGEDGVYDELTYSNIVKAHHQDQIDLEKEIEESQKYLKTVNLTNREINYIVSLIEDDDDFSTDMVLDHHEDSDDLDELDSIYQKWQEDLKLKLQQLVDS